MRDLVRDVANGWPGWVDVGVVWLVVVVVGLVVLVLVVRAKDAPDRELSARVAARRRVERGEEGRGDRDR